MMGRPSDEKILEAEIKNKTKIPEIYSRHAKNLQYSALLKLSKIAIEYANLTALKEFAKINPYAVADALFSDERMKVLSRQIFYGTNTAPELYFSLKGALSHERKAIFKRLARSSILKASLKIAGRGLRGETEKHVPYYPGMQEFDLDETIENYVERQYMDYETIVGIERQRRKKVGVLIVDTSGSMVENKIINAALSAAVLAYHMRRDKYAIVSFNTLATVIKGINENKHINKIIDEILDTVAAGYTNIYDGLYKGLIELNKVRSTRKWGIIITDGLYNRGDPPFKIAAKYPKLHVIGLPARDQSGVLVCKELAKVGRGKYYQLTTYSGIPRILTKILKETH
ncbi:MAG: vWA domain-containing protein [Candidatus Odinarchaeia archaeon]